MKQFPLNNLAIVFVLLAGFCWQAAQATEVLVVTTAQSGVQSLNKDQVSDLFLGRVHSLPDRTSATLIDQPEHLPVRQVFTERVMNKTVAQVKAHWARLYFTGRAPLPRLGKNDTEVKKMVNSTPGAIGYIEREALDNSVKVLFSVP